MVLTRPPADNARLRAALTGVDAEVVDYPCIAIETLPLAPKVVTRLKSGAYETAFFVSRNAVEHLLSQVDCPRPKRVVALGAGTAEALSQHGLHVDAQPTEARMECVLRELDQLIPTNGRVLSIRGQLGGDDFAQALQARGQDVDIAIVYRTRDAVAEPLKADARPTAVTFASPSAVRHFVARNAADFCAITIGETTAQAARAAGFQVTVAPSSETEAFAATVREWAAQFRGETTCST